MQDAAFQLGVAVGDLKRRVGQIISVEEKQKMVDLKKSLVLNPLQVSTTYIRLISSF